MEHDHDDFAVWAPDAEPTSRAAAVLGCIVLASIIIGARAVWLHLIN